MIVTKFGGTSVADAPAIERLAGIVRGRRDRQPVVVVSALAGVTDALLALAARMGHDPIESLQATLDALVERHAEIAAALRLLPGPMQSIHAEREDLLALLRSAAGRTVTPVEQDRIAGYGELWSSSLVAGALVEAGVPTTWVDIRQVLRTDDRFTRATPDIGALASSAPAAFGPLLARGQVPVTQGFLGRAPDGRPTTLGRGGSDFSATLLGAALGAECVEIWTDVDGLLTADPRIVSNARTLAVASFDEAAELATFGAKVLHPATQQPLVERGIPIVILNSSAPDRPGTTITRSARLDVLGRGPIRSISMKQGITVINVRAPRMLGAYGFLRKLFEVFERHEVVVDVLASSEVSVSLTVEDDTRLPEVCRDLERLGEVTLTGGRAIVAVVGVGLGTTSGIAARIFGAIEDVNVEVISQGASAINVTFVVEEEAAPGVVRRLHHEFFGDD